MLQFLQPFMNEVREGLSSIRRDLNSLNESVNQLSGDVEEHKNNTAVELADLTTKMETIDSKMETLDARIQTSGVYTILEARYTCGGTGGWRRVVYLDMTDTTTTCPSGWQFTGYSKRTCGRATDGRTTCNSAICPICGGTYTRVCGRIKAYQYGHTCRCI